MASSCPTCGRAGPAAAAGLEVGDILVSVDGQVGREPADGQLHLPAAGSRRERAVGGAAGRRRASASVSRRSNSAASSIRVFVDGGSRRRTSCQSSASSASRSIDGSPPPPSSSATLTGSSSSRARRARRARFPSCREMSSAASTTSEPRRCESARDAMRAFKPGTPVTLQIQREGRLMYVSFTMD